MDQHKMDHQRAVAEARRMKTLRRLVLELRRGGSEVRWRGGHIFSIDGFNIGSHIELSIDRPTNRFNPEEKRRLRFKLGGLGQQVRQFPEPKDGFDIPKLTELVLSYVAQQKLWQIATEQGNKRREIAEATIKNINKALGIGQFESPLEAESSGIGIRLRAYGVSGDKARRILQVLIETEVIKPNG